MARRRFFVPSQNISGDTAVLPAEPTHHLRDVLRLRVGDQIELFDGRGNGYTGVVTDSGREVRVGGLKKLESSGLPRPRLILATALIKPDRFEWMLQKGTELGTDEFVPLTTRFTNVRIPGHRLEGRMQRWERITTDAARQCGRRDVPVVGQPLDFFQFLELERLAPFDRFLLFERAGQLLNPDCAGSGGAVLCVGPEGGWDQSEVDAAMSAGFRVFGLGQSVLRSETAALAAVVLFRFLTDSAIAGTFPLPARSRG